MNANNTNPIAAATTSTATPFNTQQTSTNTINGNGEQVFALMANISPKVQSVRTTTW